MWGYNMKRFNYSVVLTFLLILMFLLPSTTAINRNTSPRSVPIPPLPGYCTNDETWLSKEHISTHKHQEMIPSDQSFNENIVPILQRLQPEMTTCYIQNLTSFGPRVTGSEECDDAAKYIFQEFKDMELAVRYHNWTYSDTIFGSNIEATLQGVNNPDDELYIICGHYDSVSGSPGADDNAAGTSVVLAAAKLMSQYSFNHTIRFVAFSGEEQGLIGSRYYASDSYENNDNIIAVLNADMMGYADTEEADQYVVVFDNEESSWLTDYTTQVSNDYYDYINLEVVHGGSSGRSDHASFHREGFNAIFYFEYEVNPNYHTSNDILENMNPNYATNVSRLALATLMSLGELTSIHAPEKPSRPTGEHSGSMLEEYTYVTSSIDPNNDDLWYKWDWGDGSYSEWIGPFASGESCEVNYSWEKRGEYEVQVKARDEHELESVWSDPLTVSMPKSKGLMFHELKVYFERILQRLSLFHLWDDIF